MTTMHAIIGIKDGGIFMTILGFAEIHGFVRHSYKYKDYNVCNIKLEKKMLSFVKVRF